LNISDGSVRALVVMVHGIGEHSGCYGHWAEMFATQSVGFLTFDLRGHGRSKGIRGHASMNAIKDDLQTIIKNMQKRFPGIPIVLFGHSMGGQIVLNHALAKNVKVQGIIASSPWLKLVHPPSLLLAWIVGCASYVVPWITVSTGLKAEQLSHDGAGMKSTKTDPLLHKKISFKLFTDLWKNGKMMIRNKYRLNIPLLLMHGTDDPVTSYQASKLFSQNAEGNVTFKEWHGMRHNLLNDAGNGNVFQYVMEWLSNQIIKKWNNSEL
jgi:alpha-beta hydrolase superfamily lysophospholipase